MERLPGMTRRLPSEAVVPCQGGATSGLQQYIDSCRTRVLEEIRNLIPVDSPYSGVLYEHMFDYVLRDAKMLRPALCIATCRSFGGGLDSAFPTAAVLELYHNAFLIHDDVEDGSEIRRGLPTLHERYGIPIAMNVGDAMLALALEPLLDNMWTIGMGKALRVLQEISRMARESAEGQALELSHIRNGSFDLTDPDYLHLAHKKTSYYSFVAPMVIGAHIAGTRSVHIDTLRRFGEHLGIGFQIQDDVLNLTADYGKEANGDLWEGKCTLILIHMMRSSSPDEQVRARRVLTKPRPSALLIRDRGSPNWLALDATRREQDTRRSDLIQDQVKTESDIEFLVHLIGRYHSIEYATSVASRKVAEAKNALDELAGSVAPSVHLDFLQSLVNYVVERQR